MNAYIWYRKSTSITAKKLANALGIPCGKERPLATDTKIIAWGAHGECSTTLDEAIINCAALRFSSNKLDAHLRMLSHGVAVAPLWTHGCSIPRHGTWLHRKVRHQQALDIRISQPEDFAHSIYPNGYAVQYIPTQSEYRIHVAMGKVIRCQIKTGPPDNPDNEVIIRTHRLGWNLDGKYIRVTPDILKAEAVKALQALGYDFGAVDIGLTPEGKPVVFEVNSAPALENTKTFNAYVKTLTEMCS